MPMNAGECIETFLESGIQADKVVKAQYSSFFLSFLPLFCKDFAKSVRLDNIRDSFQWQLE